MGRLLSQPGGAHTAGEHWRTSSEGMACVDVGGDRGALVLRAPADRAGVEVEIAPRADPSARTHVAVLERPTASGVVHAALFPSLRAGEYDVLDERGRPTARVDVVAGAVTTAEWC